MPLQTLLCPVIPKWLIVSTGSYLFYFKKVYLFTVFVVITTNNIQCLFISDQVLYPSACDTPKAAEAIPHSRLRHQGHGEGHGSRASAQGHTAGLDSGQCERSRTMVLTV